MTLPVVPLPSLEQLRDYVRRTLCDRDRVDVAEARLRQGLIRKRGRPCGLFFQVEGPRLLRTHAIWAGEEDRILFYDSTGQRFAETRLSESPDPAGLSRNLSD